MLPPASSSRRTGVCILHDAHGQFVRKRRRADDVHAGFMPKHQQFVAFGVKGRDEADVGNYGPATQSGQSCPPGVMYALHARAAETSGEFQAKGTSVVMDVIFQLIVIHLKTVLTSRHAPQNARSSPDGKSQVERPCLPGPSE
jgi:hypothetical protein